MSGVQYLGGEWDDDVHLFCGRFTWCRKVWPADLRHDRKGLKKTHSSDKTTCTACLAVLVADRLLRLEV